MDDEARSPVAPLNRAGGLHEGLLGRMQACGRSARVLAPAKQKQDQEEPRAVLLVRLHRVEQWFGRLPIARPSQKAKAQRVPKAWGAYANAPAIRSSKGTT